MSLTTEVFMFEKYGPRLNVPQLAELLNITASTLHNQRSAGTFPIPTYRDLGKIFADYRDVAAHFDRLRQIAK
jgi:hypothetical protein